MSTKGLKKAISVDLGPTRKNILGWPDRPARFKNGRIYHPNVKYPQVLSLELAVGVRSENLQKVDDSLYYPNNLYLAKDALK